MKKKTLLITGIVVLALLAGGLAFGYHQRSADTKPATRSSDGVNYNPPTESDKADSEAQKGAGDGSNSNPITNDGRKLHADVEIGSTWQSSGNFNVNGFVLNVAENDGTCTLIATKGLESIKKSRAAVANASTTNCGLLSIPMSSLSTGTWEIILQYSSTKYSGVSDKMKVDL